MNAVEKIAELVEEKGITEKEFVKEIGLNRSAFTDWRSGKSRSYRDHIIEIADYFGVTTDYLLRDGQEKNNLVKNEEEGNMMHRFIMQFREDEPKDVREKAKEQFEQLGWRVSDLTLTVMDGVFVPDGFNLEWNKEETPQLPPNIHATYQPMREEAVTRKDIEELKKMISAQNASKEEVAAEPAPFDKKDTGETG